MIFERENGEYSKPIVSKEHISYIEKQYSDGKSQNDIAKEMLVSPKFISKLMHTNNIDIRNDREQALKYSCNENYFNIIDTEHKAYWLGFMYADGYITKETQHSSQCIGISISKIDIEHLNKFKQDLCSTHKINSYKVNQGYKIGTSYVRILINSDTLANDLIKYGCIQKKTDKLLFPNIQEHLLIHFIRGYIDGDGSITSSTKPNGKINIAIKITGTEEIIDGIKSYFNVEHLRLEKRHKDRNNNNVSLTIGGNVKVKRILEELYQEATIYLDRKYEKQKQLLEIYKNQL